MWVQCNSTVQTLVLKIIGLPDNGLTHMTLAGSHTLKHREFIVLTAKLAVAASTV